MVEGRRREKRKKKGKAGGFRIYDARGITSAGSQEGEVSRALVPGASPSVCVCVCVVLSLERYIAEATASNSVSTLGYSASAGAPASALAPAGMS